MKTPRSKELQSQLDLESYTNCEINILIVSAFYLQYV